MIVETCDYTNAENDRENLPQWAQTELEYLDLIKANTFNLERKHREHALQGNDAKVRT